MVKYIIPFYKINNYIVNVQLKSTKSYVKVDLADSLWKHLGMASLSLAVLMNINTEFRRMLYTFFYKW